MKLDNRRCAQDEIEKPLQNIGDSKNLDLRPITRRRALMRSITGTLFLKVESESPDGVVGICHLNVYCLDI